MISGHTKRVVKTESHELELNRDDMLELLRKAGHEIPEHAALQVYFAVPGGGDWSNTDVDIDSKNPIRVQWQITTESDSAG